MKIRCLYKIRFLKALGIQAITLYPLILFAESKEEVSESLMRHELEHIYQVKSLGWMKFYFAYLKHYFNNRRKGLSHHQAYWSNPFEVEARQKEGLVLTLTERREVGWNTTSSLDRS